MGIRFTSTDKWQDKWFRSLTPYQKLIWEYLRDCCNNAGFLELDFASISFHTGVEVDELSDIMKGLKRGYLGAKEGYEDWIWIKNFLKHQKNLPLNPGNNSHKQIIYQIGDQGKRFDIETIISHIQEDANIFNIQKVPKIKNSPPLNPGGEKIDHLELKEAQFEKFWTMYDKKVNLKAVKPKFMKLKDGDIVDIFKQLPEYVKSTPDAQFRMAPEVYLNGQRWTDEIKTHLLSNGGGDTHVMTGKLSSNPKGGIHG